MPLSLKGRASKPKRVSERSFEEAFANALREQGLENWHISARGAGWPDRYVAGGIWIEFKVLDRLSCDQLEPEQRARMRSLSKAGERVFYCARHGDRAVFVRYPFDHGVFDKRGLPELFDSRAFTCNNSAYGLAIKRSLWNA